MGSLTKLLALDTATEACSVALTTDGGDDIDQLLQITPSGHSDLVLEMVNQLLRKHAIELKDLDAVAVDIGPGSFTGLRIGIGVAQGLAYGAGLPVIGIGSLDALAAQCPDGFSVPAIDARMKQIYWGVFEKWADVPVPVAGPFVTSPADVTTMLINIDNSRPNTRLDSTSKVYSIGNGWSQYADSLPKLIEDKHITAVESALPQARQIVRLALCAASADFCSPLELAATYVRNDVAKLPSKTQHKT